MKTTIIVPDNAVYQNGVAYLDLDLSSCNIPADVRVLQFDDKVNIGWLEPHDKPDGTSGGANTTINTLPEWAIAAINLWNAADSAAKAPKPNK
jgi:hypothetical protein